MLIYIGDITYDQKSTQAPVPLNAAYVAAYATEKFGSEIEIKLFKFPITKTRVRNKTTPII